MVKIRLKRLGRKKRPFYRVVVTHMRNRRDGKPIAELGFYDPVQKQLKLDKQAALDWVSKGAAVSEIAQRLINQASETGELVQLERTRAARPSKKVRAKLAEEEKAKAEAEAAAQAAAAEKAAAEAAPAPEAEQPAAAEEPAAEAKETPAEA